MGCEAKVYGRLLKIVTTIFALHFDNVIQLHSPDGTTCNCRFHNVLQMAQAAGESDKALQGLHELYLEAKAKDPRMDAVSGP